MLDSITGVSPWDLETGEMSVGNLSEPEDEQKEDVVEQEEEQDFGWIAVAISES